MDVSDKVVVVTGAASGIGLAMAQRFVADRARAVIMTDVAPGLFAAARAAGAQAMELDVTSEAQTRAVVDAVEAEHGPVDLFCANAGILTLGGVEVADDDWHRTLEVNLMAHVYAARVLLPRWVQRGSGYLLHTASAAGLLTGLPALPYAVSKHAVVALAEWLAIAHGPDGVRFSCLCPMGVRTPMMQDGGDQTERELGSEAMTPEAVAECVIDGLAAERFLILTHPSVAEYERRRVADRDRWLAGMSRLRANVTDGA